MKAIEDVKKDSRVVGQPAPPRGIPAGGAVRAAWRTAGGRVVVAAASSAA